MPGDGAFSGGLSNRSRELGDAGGHFYRTDFQVHTPRDTQWHGQRPETEDERTAWAASFVAAARASGLQAVAISDHHDFAMFPYVKAAAADEMIAEGSAVPENERLVVFPALELTLSVPCQAILVLDADFPEDRLDDVLKALHFDPIDPLQPSIPQTVVLPDSGDVNELLEKLDKYNWLAGRYILLPNVTPEGYKSATRTGLHEKFESMRVVGGYLDKSVAALGEPKYAGKKRILEGLDSNWGDKRLALFETSDSRSEDFSALGTRSTWVKWATPTAEAIRQACLGQDSRIAQTEPALPNSWISGGRVSEQVHGPC